MMRIVGMNSKKVWVQIYNGRTWDQTVMNIADFEAMMQNEYPEQWKEYKNSGTEKTAADWFYNYGETENMIRKGTAHIFA